MPRPSFQLYPADVLINHELSFCSWAAKGALLYTLCKLHDSKQYGVTRHTLAEVARAIGCPVELLEELARGGVIHGCDQGHYDGFVFRPMHARKLLDPVIGVEPCEGPVWYIPRMVKDEHGRKMKAAAAAAAVANKKNEEWEHPTLPPPLGEQLGEAFSEARGDYSGEGSGEAFGEEIGEAPSSSSPSSNETHMPGSRGTPVPENFALSERNAKWAKREGIEDVEAWREAFVIHSRMHGIEYRSHDAGFRAFIVKRRAAGDGPND
jgi:hypothetical protein